MVAIGSAHWLPPNECVSCEYLMIRLSVYIIKGFHAQWPLKMQVHNETTNNIYIDIVRAQSIPHRILLMSKTPSTKHLELSCRNRSRIMCARFTWNYDWCGFVRIIKILQRNTQINTTEIHFFFHFGTISGPLFRLTLIFVASSQMKWWSCLTELERCVYFQIYQNYLSISHNSLVMKYYLASNGCWSMEIS